MNDPTPSFDESLLTAYLDNELSDAEREQVEAALAKSLPLQSLLADLAHVRELVSQCQVPFVAPHKNFSDGPWNESSASASTTQRVSPNPISITGNTTGNSFLYRNARLLASMAACVPLLVGVIGLVFLRQGMSNSVVAIGSRTKTELSSSSGPSPASNSKRKLDAELSPSVESMNRSYDVPSFPPPGAIAPSEASSPLPTMASPAPKSSRAISPKVSEGNLDGTPHPDAPSKKQSAAPMEVKPPDLSQRTDPSARFSRAAPEQGTRSLPASDGPDLGTIPSLSPSDLSTNMFYAFLNDDVQVGNAETESTEMGARTDSSTKREGSAPPSVPMAHAEGTNSAPEDFRNLQRESKLLWVETYRGRLSDLDEIESISMVPRLAENNAYRNSDFMRFGNAGNEGRGSNKTLSPSPSTSGSSEGDSRDQVALSLQEPIGSIWVYSPTNKSALSGQPQQDTKNRSEEVQLQRTARDQQFGAGGPPSGYSGGQQSESLDSQSKQSRGRANGLNNDYNLANSSDPNESTIVLLVPVDRWDEAIQSLGQRGFPIANLQNLNQQNRAIINNAPSELVDEFIAEWNDPQGNQWKISRDPTSGDPAKGTKQSFDSAPQWKVDKSQNAPGAPEIAFRRLIIKIRNRAGKSSSNE